MKKTRWWQRYHKLGRVGRTVWFWTPDRDPTVPRAWAGSNVQWTNRWFWVGSLEVCWLSRAYLAEEGS